MTSPLPPFQRISGRMDKRNLNPNTLNIQTKGLGIGGRGPPSSPRHTVTKSNLSYQKSPRLPQRVEPSTAPAVRAPITNATRGRGRYVKKNAPVKPKANSTQIFSESEDEERKSVSETEFDESNCGPQISKQSTIESSENVIVESPETKVETEVLPVSNAQEQTKLCDDAQKCQQERTVSAIVKESLDDISTIPTEIHRKISSEINQISESNETNTNKILAAMALNLKKESVVELEKLKMHEGTSDGQKIGVSGKKCIICSLS